MRSERRRAWLNLMLFMALCLTPVAIRLSAPLHAQESTAKPAVPAAEGSIVAPGQTNEWGVGVIVSYLSAILMQQWKRSGLRGLNEDSTRHWQKFIAWMIAAASAVGIHATFDAAAGSLLITGLTLSGILATGGEVVRQYVLQQITYHGVVAKMDEPTHSPA